MICRNDENLKRLRSDGVFVYKKEDVDTYGRIFDKRKEEIYRPKKRRNRSALADNVSGIFAVKGKIERVKGINRKDSVGKLPDKPSTMSYKLLSDAAKKNRKRYYYDMNYSQIKL